MKILGCLYAAVPGGEKRQEAEKYLQRATDLQPEDLEAWLELAAVLERTNAGKAIVAYEHAVRLLLSIPESVPVEVTNNIGSLHFQLGNFVEAEVVIFW